MVILRLLLCLFTAALLVGTAYCLDTETIKGIGHGCFFSYLPSQNAVYVMVNLTRRVVRRDAVATFCAPCTTARVEMVSKGQNTVLASATLRLTNGQSPETKITVPALAGDYEIRFILDGVTEPVTIVKPFTRKKFVWEGNTLGITDEVFPPFTPVKATGREVQVVLRHMTMNSFGLWDKVITEERNILASPMSIRYTTSTGEGKWNKPAVKLEQRTDTTAIYTTSVDSPAVRVTTRSTVEFDGCMKVEMTLAPGKIPRKINKLWVDIPFKDQEVPLFHQIADTLRFNYAGKTPAGEGVIWDSLQSRHKFTWQNSFNGYIWLGAAERGLCWFADNDKGWFTEKDGSKIPLQEIIRNGDTLTLRVYLINIPTTLKSATRLVFGLQASPTKPMPDNWRANGPHIPPHGGPVNPWGGIYCAYKTPYNNDWQIVDKIIEGQKTGKIDRAWFETYAKEHDPPPVYGTWNWLESVLYFASRRERPQMTYFEEMMAGCTEDEWLTFQDEWGLDHFTPREWPDESIMRQGNNVVPSQPIVFSRSYQDYSLYYENEWMKRGVSLYWDNTYPKIAGNPQNSEAYYCADGSIQPAWTLWAQREYTKRTWNLFQYWRKNQRDPLEWSMHMTNTLMLPVHAFATVTLDYELWSETPFTPEMILTQTTGLHTGSYPHSLFPLYGSDNVVMKQFVADKANANYGERTEWGMRFVHEIISSGPGNNLVRNFGYGTPEVVVHNYWADTPVMQVSNEQIKWIVLAKPAEKTALIVLASWSPATSTVYVRLNNATLGFVPGSKYIDAETGEPIAAIAPGVFQVNLQAPYGVRIIKMTAE